MVVHWEHDTHPLDNKTCLCVLVDVYYVYIERDLKVLVNHQT